MFCSDCGAGEQNPKSYCRRCGGWLPELTSRAGMSFGGETPQQNIASNLFFSALSAIVALISAAALYIIYLGSGEGKWSVYLAAAFCLCMAGWQVSSFIISLKLRQRLKVGRGDAQSNASLGQRHSEAPSLPEFDESQLAAGRSVTEGTTEILKPVPRKPARSKEG